MGRIEYLCNKMYYDTLEKEEAKELVDYINNLEDRINKEIEYIENGSDFKSIHFKETDTEFWKIIMEDNLKNNLLNILKGSDKE